MKKCPYCAREIDDQAVHCRYCGEVFAKKPPRPAVVHSSIALFDILLIACGSRQDELVKVLRQALDISRSEAQALCDTPGSRLLEKIPQSRAVALKNQLEAAGALVELRPAGEIGVVWDTPPEPVEPPAPAPPKTRQTPEPAPRPRPAPAAAPVSDDHSALEALVFSLLHGFIGLSILVLIAVLLLFFWK